MTDKIAQFYQYLADSGLKSTRQRDLVVKTFFQATGHVSIEELYRQVRKKDPKVGLVTVYRTLKLLREAGLAEERRFGDRHALYEKQSSHHDHLICTHCGKIVEFENDAIEEMQDDVARKYGFAILFHKHELYGLCKECRSPAAKGKAAKRAFWGSPEQTEGQRS